MVEEFPELMAAHGSEHFEVLDPDRDHFLIGISAEASDPLNETLDRIGFLCRHSWDLRAVGWSDRGLRPSAT